MALDYSSAWGDPQKAMVVGNDYVNSLFDRAKKVQDDNARTQAGQAYVQGDYTGAAATLGNMGDIKGAADIQDYAVKQFQARHQLLQQAVPTLTGILQKGGPQALSQAFEQIAPNLKGLGLDDATINNVRQGLQTNPEQTLQVLGIGAKKNLTYQKLGNGQIAAIDENGQVFNVIGEPETKDVAPGASVLQLPAYQPGGGATPAAGGSMPAPPGAPPSPAAGAGSPPFDPKALPGLVTLGGGRTGNPQNLQGFNPAFGGRLQAMLAEYNSITGGKPTLTSGTRTIADQEWMQTHGTAPAAAPGTSPHETDIPGGAVAADFNTQDVVRMEQLGLLKKYGLMHLGGPEFHHVQLASNAPSLPAGATSAPPASPTGGRVLFTAPSNKDWQPLNDGEKQNYPGAVQINRATGEVKYPPQGAMTGDAATIEYAAKRYLAGDQTAISGRGTAFKIAAIKRAQEISHDLGGTPEGDAARLNLRTANAAALTQNTRLGAFISQAEITAQKNADLVLQLAPRGVGPAKVPAIDAWLQAGRKSIGGNVDVSNLDVAIRTFANEYARVMSGGTGSQQLSDASRREMDNLLTRASTLDQIRGAIGTMKKDMANRTAGIQEEHDALVGALGGSPSASAPSAGASGGSQKIGRFTVTAH